MKQRILGVRLGRINITIGWDDVVVASQHYRNAGDKEIGSMRQEAIHPGDLVNGFRSWRVAIRRVEGCNQHTVHRRLDIARLCIAGIAGQFRSRDDRFETTRQNGDAVPGFLSAPHNTVARLLDRGFGKLSVLGFEFL